MIDLSMVSLRVIRLAVRSIAISTRRNMSFRDVLDDARSVRGSSSFQDIRFTAVGGKPGGKSCSASWVPLQFLSAHFTSGPGHPYGRSCRGFGIDIVRSGWQSSGCLSTSRTGVLFRIGRGCPRFRWPVRFVSGPWRFRVCPFVTVLMWQGRVSCCRVIERLVAVVNVVGDRSTCGRGKHQPSR